MAGRLRSECSNVRHPNPILNMSLRAHPCRSSFGNRFSSATPARKPRGFHSLEILEARIAPAFSAVVELSGLDAGKGFKINGAAVNDSSGFSVGDAGDINGDGI